MTGTKFSSVDDLSPGDQEMVGHIVNELAQNDGRCYVRHRHIETKCGRLMKVELHPDGNLTGLFDMYGHVGVSVLWDDGPDEPFVVPLGSLTVFASRYPEPPTGMRIPKIGENE